jgi:hypothetical protein
LLAVAVVALAAALLLVVTSRHGGETPVSGRPPPWIVSKAEFFGVNAPLLREYASPQRSRALDALAASMAAEGVHWARVVFDQSVEQAVPGPIDWRIPDRVVGALTRHGVRTQALFIGTPQWEADPAARLFRCGSRSAPGDVDAWARFLGAAVARYGRQGTFWQTYPQLKRLPIEVWEIGNEENTRLFWCPGADPKHYASVYAASRSAALAADPRAMVIVGGLAPVFSDAGSGDMTVSDFLRGMVGADHSLPDEIPAVAVHPYASTPSLVMHGVQLFREAMRTAGLGSTPMFANEFGWYTSGPPGPALASQSQRAQRIRDVVLAARRTNCGLVALGVHGWVTNQANPADPEDWYGLADPLTGVPNASGRAFGAAIAAAQSGRWAPKAPALRHLCG